jgi:hypothetical protein
MKPRIKPEQAIESINKIEEMYKSGEITEEKRQQLIREIQKYTINKEQ